MKKLKEFIEISKEVEHALKKGMPVIALESTIISHGMPYPQNLEVATKLENMAREVGVTPATICLMDGKIKIGLDETELAALATRKGVAKVSRRNFAECLAKKQTGATTVAATMIAANMAGIKVFATGGIGGVHREADKTFDISADLIEFSRTPVIVVSAGAKAILDLPKTLEYLETHGVPVYGYQTDIFPAFYSSKSKLKVNKIDRAEDIASIYSTSVALGFNNGIIVANPVPEEHEIPNEEMEQLINQALMMADTENITGYNVTPFLLGEIVKRSQGRSLTTNIHLVENNVKLACKIAKELV